MNVDRTTLGIVALVVAFAGCGPDCACRTPRTVAFDDEAWRASEWISVAEAPVRKEGVGKPKPGDRAADGVSWFVRKVENRKPIRSAKWMVSGLGVFEVYLNGKRVGGDDALKPGFTHCGKTRVAFTYDVTEFVRTGEGEANVLAAEVSGGWWRDKITGFQGLRSAFRGVLEIVYADGTKELDGTNVADWRCGVAGPITHAAIFDGEEYDARVKSPYFGEGLNSKPIPNDEFKGVVVPTEGAEVCRRFDLALDPVGAYCWKGVRGSDPAKGLFGTVMKTKTFAAGEVMRIGAGETLVVDFGQNAAAVPSVRFRAARGTVISFLPGEMLNDGNGAESRGCDGPEGSLYHANYRDCGIGMKAVYTFAGDGAETYLPRHTFFGYRYLSVTATGAVEIESLRSVPVTSVRKDLELGKIETGDADVNRLISNIRWGELSNYLSVPTDCPQRDERLGWTADTQVFAEAGSFNADTRAFFRKWMRDMRDSQHPLGGFPGVAPKAQYGEDYMRIGWSDAGIIVPYQVWKQFGDRTIVDDNWAAMVKCVKHCRETKYRFANLPEAGKYQYGDWLSFEKYEARSRSVFVNGDKAAGKVIPEAVTYWDYLGACYWLWNEQMLAAMAKGTGRDATEFEAGAVEAKRYLKETFFDPKDGQIVSFLRDMQGPALFALKFGLVEGEARERTIEGLRQNVAAHGGCLQTGFLGTSILMDTLSANGLADVAYTILLQHENPSWLYSVDQGATTIWERWNSYTKKDGFGPVDMNSFNHYAYGAVLAWMYKTMAGIAADPAVPGFKRIVMAPQPDRRIGHVTAEYRSAAGLIRSAWCYEGKNWIWNFTVPEGAVAVVTLPGERASRVYPAGSYRVERPPDALTCASSDADVPRLRVGIIADTHLVTRQSENGEQNCNGFEPTLRFFDSCKADAVLICGDLTDFGTVAAMRRLAEIWQRVFPGGRRSDGEPIVQLFHYGDHDMGGYAHKNTWARGACEDPAELKVPIVEYGPAKIWEECFHEKWEPIQIKEVKGYTFVLAHHPLHTPESHNGNVIPGLADFLAKRRFDPKKPFFYSQHRPAARTVCGPWPNDVYDPADTKAVLKNYPNCIAFFAHWHRTCTDELNLWQKEFTAVEVPSINYCCTREGRQNGFHPVGGLVRRTNLRKSWQALFSVVYDDRVDLYRYDMLNRRQIARPWTIRLPHPDPALASETRAKRSVPPEFAPGAQITLAECVRPDKNKRPVDRVVVSFPVAHGDSRHARACDYLVTARVDGGKDIVRQVYSSGPYWIDELDVKPVECHFAKDELPADWRTRVRFTVAPRDSYGNCGAPLVR